jgi:hypothetical protein
MEKRFRHTPRGIRRRDASDVYRAPRGLRQSGLLAGVGWHKAGTSRDHTRGVLERNQKDLERWPVRRCRKCLKVSVFLADLKDYDRMNAVYRSFRLGFAAAGAHHHGRRRRARQFADRNRRNRLYLRKHAHVRKMVPARPSAIFRRSGGSRRHDACLGGRRAGARHRDHTGTAEDNLFTRVGVRPILNAAGTYTILSGSRSLPEVKQAMFEASHYYVQMDEMMDGVGKELARAERL